MQQKLMNEQKRRGISRPPEICEKQSDTRNYLLFAFFALLEVFDLLVSSS